MKINRVTITGADDSIRPSDLNILSNKYPFVEWAILLSAKQEGKKRFPSLEWIEELKEINNNLQLSGHLCGSWVRDLLIGNPSFITDRPTIYNIFNRFQLNFHAEELTVMPDLFMAAVKKLSRGREIIFQADGRNNNLIVPFINKNEYVAVIHDVSHGAGVLTDNWPKYITGITNIYAGGLSPDNVVEQLNKIEQVVGNKIIGVDVETKVRSNNDQQFDLDLVERFLDNCQPWII